MKMIGFRNAKLLCQKGTSSLSQCRVKKYFKRFEAEKFWRLERKLCDFLICLFIWWLLLLKNRNISFYFSFSSPSGNPELEIRSFL